MLVKIKSTYGGWGIADTRSISIAISEAGYCTVWVEGCRFASIDVDQYKKLLELMLDGKEMKEI